MKLALLGNLLIIGTVLIITACTTIEKGNYYKSKSVAAPEGASGYWVSVHENNIVGDLIVFLSLKENGQFMSCSNSFGGGHELKLIMNNGLLASITTTGVIYKTHLTQSQFNIEGWLNFERTDHVLAKCKKFFEEVDFEQ